MENFCECNFRRIACRVRLIKIFWHTRCMKNIYLFLGLFVSIASCSQESNLQANLEQSETFLEKNLLDPRVVEIEPGLQYLVLESSDSNLSKPLLTDTITADFHGTLEDGSIFWSSIELGEPLVIQLSQLIPGCQKAISQMHEGESWRVFIHPELAYGEEGRPTIPPNSVLIFDIALHSISGSP